ncbi:30 kDa ribonucleoprotein, chloroplastic-like [Silene latifolia]|uniref:30 kDa ribonucleoprotein, chloroplastic-like n=1 Tax=Silene latifolia TaxID=37657 RepID=UPI003D77A636
MASSTTIFMSSLTPKTLTFSKLSSPFASFFFSSPSKPTLPNTLSFPSSTKHFEPLISGFVRNVAVSPEYGQREQEQFSPDLKLFVGNLPFNIDSSELAGLFGNAGTVEMVEVIYDKTTGRSRGFGFVTMSSSAEVEAAAQQFNGYELDGRPLRVNAGPPPPKREGFEARDGFEARGGRGGGRSFENANRIHVSNLSWQVDDSSLKTLFSESGDVVEAKVIYDRESGRSRGFGFVTYGSADEVNSAIESLDGVDFNGRNIRVTVAESKPRRF